MCVFDLDVTVGALLLARSYYELTVEKDYSMAIILSAAGFEAELSRLFGKWKRIDQGLEGKEHFSDEEIEKMLLTLPTMIDRRIKEVCRLLDARGISDFVRSDDELRQTIEDRFHSLRIPTIAKDIQTTLFWPRNKILHAGFANYGLDDASGCYSIANVGLRILKKMDLARRKKLNATMG